MKFLENSREILKNPEKNILILPSVRFKMYLQMAYLSECKFALVAFLRVSPLQVSNVPSNYLFHCVYSNVSSNFLPEWMQSHIEFIFTFDLSPLCFSSVSSNIYSKRMHCHNSRIDQDTPHAVSNSNLLYCSQANLGSILQAKFQINLMYNVTLVGEGSWGRRGREFQNVSRMCSRTCRGRILQCLGTCREGAFR